MAASAEELFDRFHLAIYRYLLRMTGRRDVAEDLTQDVFVGYDLWLVDQEPGGRQVTRHIEMAGRQRESINVRFVPIGWSSDGSPVAEGGNAEILVEVSGTIKGRLQADGSVQIAVTPNRTVRLGSVGGGTGYREKLLTARPGETIRMDIPPSGPGAARTHRTSLSLTVRAW